MLATPYFAPQSCVPPNSQQDFTYNPSELKLFVNYTIKQTFLMAYNINSYESILENKSVSRKCGIWTN